MAAGSATICGDGPSCSTTNDALPAAEAALERLDGLADERAEVHQLELVAARLLQPRELEDPLHERRQPRDFPAHDPQVLRQFLGRANVRHLHGLDCGAHQRQRRLELVRCVGDEIRLHARELVGTAVRVHRQAEADQHQQHRRDGRPVRLQQPAIRALALTSNRHSRGVSPPATSRDSMRATG